MSKVKIYQFQMYDSQSDTMQTSRRWGTKEAVTEIAKGIILEKTCIEVDHSVIESDIPGLTNIGFNPNPAPGFQRVVK